jgi:cardiolipin synthase A/B
MTHPEQHRTRGGWRAALRRWLRGGFVTLLAGCQAVPAQVATCRWPDLPVPRVAVVAKQVAVDTALQTVCHPLRSVGVALVEPAMAVQEAAHGLFYKRLGLCLARSPDPVPACRPTLDPDALEAELRRVAGDELQPAWVRLILDGQEALTSLQQAIDGATCQIDVLMYLWDSDPLGWDVARRLAARAGPTVRVRILVDGGGNLLQGEPDDGSAGHVNAVICWLARQPFVEVIRTRNAFFRFDHRKLVLIDGRLAWSGGRNFTWGAFFRAHDLTYTLSGPLTAELATRYESFWCKQGGQPGPSLPAPPPLSAGAANTQARLVRTRPYEANLARVVYTAVDRARSHIYVENPYFADSRLFVKLAAARRRGVDVRVVLTLDSGSKLIDAANKAVINRLLRAGIRVYLFPRQTHVKALSVDGLWAYIGTGNFDPLSLRHNRELGVAVSHGPLVGELEERLFQADFQPEWEVRDPLPLSGYEPLAEAIASMFL